MLIVFGLLSGLLALISNIPYAIDTYKGVTKPHRVTWGIFLLLNLIYLANHIAAGANESLYIIIAFIISTGTIFTMSIRKGVGGKSKLDIVVLVGAIAGLILWQILDNPTASIIANATAGTIASIPTYKKAWLDPASETKTKWFIGTFAGVFATLAVGSLKFSLLILPVLTVLFQGSMFLIIQFREQRV